MFIIPAVLDGQFCLRIALGSEQTTSEHILEIWNDIQSFTEILLKSSENLAIIPYFIQKIEVNKELIKII